MQNYPQPDRMVPAEQATDPQSGMEPALPSIMSASDQSILHVTLKGPSLLLTIVALILGVQILSPSLTAILISIAPLPYIVHNDYKAFLSLGPGGTPSTWAGYIKITYLRLFTLKDPYTPPPFPIASSTSILPTVGIFSNSAPLPSRSGPRPTVAGIAPQRQLDQPGSLQSYLDLRTTLIDTAIHSPSTLRTGTSCFEKAGLALFALCPLNNTCNGEIVHIHHSDRSMHMNLHPADAAEVLKKGWGQRHPLAKGGWMRKYVPREFMMVYAPRNKEELEVVGKIVQAAAWWVMGERIDIAIPGDGEVAKV